MSELNRLWDEHSRLIERMMDAAQKEFVPAAEGTVQVRLSMRMVFDLLLGRTLRFKTDRANIIVMRK
jgi:hypothetical protein